jgi:hypothetical protein
MPAHDRDEAIVFPVYGGRTGHPPLLGQEVRKKVTNTDRTNLRDALAALMAPRLAEAFINGLAPEEPPETGPFRFLSRPDEGLLTDIDTPEDFVRAQERKIVLEDWPKAEDLWTLLELVDPGPWVKRHSLAVARGALRLGLALIDVCPKGDVCPEFGFLGGLIHDVDRSSKNHEIKAKERLEALGWPELATIVGEHKDLTWPIEPGKWRKPVLYGAMSLYLADKFFMENNLVGLEERFGVKIDSFQADEKAVRKAKVRLNIAQGTENWFRQKLGQEPLSVLARPSNNPLEELADRLEKLIGL